MFRLYWMASHVVSYAAVIRVVTRHAMLLPTSVAWRVTLITAAKETTSHGATKSYLARREQQQPRAAQVVHTHWTLCRHGWLRGFGALNYSPCSWIFTFVSVASSLRSYLSSSATSGIGVYIAQNLLRDRHGTASLCHRNCAATTVLVCEQKPYPV